MTYAILAALGVGIFILPVVIGYLFGFRDKTPEELRDPDWEGK
jgi:hypothetical protein